MTSAMPKLTYADYLELEARTDQRYEYIAGVVRAMAGGTAEHARLAGRMILILGNALAGRDCNVYTPDLRVRIEALDRSTYADVAVVCGANQKSSTDREAVVNPVILVEVLSPSTEAYDRGEKWACYQRIAALQEYVLVSQNEPCVEVFRRDRDQWISRRFGPGEVFELPSHGVRVAVDDVYSDPQQRQGLQPA